MLHRRNTDLISDLSLPLGKIGPHLQVHSLHELARCVDGRDPHFAAFDLPRDFTVQVQRIR